MNGGFFYEWNERKKTQSATVTAFAAADHRIRRSLYPPENRAVKNALRGLQAESAKFRIFGNY